VPEAARAAGDYLFARAFAELAATGNEGAVSILATACLCLARGEALQRAQSHDAETSIESYLDRCALKTGKLFEAACLLGAGVTKADGAELAEFGLALGVAFQIADDILDYTEDESVTGKPTGFKVFDRAMLDSLTRGLTLDGLQTFGLKEGRWLSMTPEEVEKIPLRHYATGVAFLRLRKP
jgi:hypothetical protein